MSTNVTPFPSQAGALAPINPQEPKDQLAEDRREERVNAPRLHAYLLKTLDAIASLDQNENLKIHNEMVTNVAYYDGRWNGRLENGTWVDNQSITGAIVPQDNDFKKQCDKLLMEMSRSKIGYVVDATLKHQNAKREAAEFAQLRVNVNQDRIETESFIQAENQSLLLKLIAYRYTFFDKNADSQEQSMELQVLRQMTSGTQVLVCRTCGAAANESGPETKETGNNAAAFDPEPADIDAPCPNCGDTKRKMISAPPSEALDIQQKKVPAGRVVTVRPDATMVQLDLNARDIPGSSFIRWRLVLRRCDWEAMYPNQKIPSSDESTESRNRSIAQNYPSNSVAFGTAGTADSDVGGGDQFEKIEGELVWLDARVYQRYQNKESETLGKDKVLAPGTLLTDLFPDGVCITRIGNKILDLVPSNKNKCWTMCVYGLREHALHGSGVSALRGPQDIINEANALILANQVYGATGRELIRSGAFEGDQLPSIDQVLYINAEPEVNDLAKWAAGRIQPNMLSAEVYAFREAMRGSMVDAAGTSSLSMQGAADLKVLGTATGVEASRDQAVGRMIPNRKLQAFMGTEWARQVLEIERENYTPEVFLESAEKGNQKGEFEYTERGIMTFFQSNVCNDFSVKPVEGSWMPVSPAQEQAKASEFGMMAGQMKDAPNSTEILALMAPKFGIPFSVNEFGAAQRTASLRLEEYARVAASQANSPQTPETVQTILDNCAEWARVDPIMDDHPAFLDYYEDWWMSDAGRNADFMLRMVISAIHKLHKDGLVAQGQDKTTMDTAAKAPALAAADEAAAKQQQEAHDQAEQDMIKQELGKAHLAQLDREHEAEVQLRTQMALNEQEAGIAKDAEKFETDQEIREDRVVAKLTPKKPASGSTAST